MGYSGKLELKRKARFLRKKGLSIKEIEKKLKVSRSSISLWVRDIELSNQQIKYLYASKKTGALKGSIIAARNKKKEREKLVYRLLKEGEEQVGKISKRDRFIAGISLYYGEGGKTDGQVSFTNSDPYAIKFMVNWLREFYSISENRIRGSLYVHDNLDKDKAEKYWSRITKIPLKQFTKAYIVRNNPKRLRKVKNQHGVFRIKISDANLHRETMGLISGLFKK
jgi:transcriptional regulator with XRE-family HTH domain